MDFLVFGKKKLGMKNISSVMSINLKKKIRVFHVRLFLANMRYESDAD